jgi:hypothetical protein
MASLILEGIDMNLLFRVWHCRVSNFTLLVKNEFDLKYLPATNTLAYSAETPIT